MDAFENIRADLSGLQALAVLFTDFFATSTDEKTLLLQISCQKTVFLNSAWLMCDLIGRIIEKIDAAIDAGTRESAEGGIQ